MQSSMKIFFQIHSPHFKFSLVESWNCALVSVPNIWNKMMSSCGCTSLRRYHLTADVIANLHIKHLSSNVQCTFYAQCTQCTVYTLCWMYKLLYMLSVRLTGELDQKQRSCLVNIKHNVMFLLRCMMIDTTFIHHLPHHTSIYITWE